MKRRKFIREFFLRFSCLLAGTVLAYPVFSFITFRKNTIKAITFHPDECRLEVNFKEGVYLIREGTEQYALSAQCTHLGCTLSYDSLSQRFRCPCHGSVFGLSGEREAGPAKKGLYRVPMTQKANGDIVVTLTL